MIPLAILAALVVYAIAKQSERAPTHAAGDAAPSDPATGSGGMNMGINDGSNQDLLSKIIASTGTLGDRGDPNLSKAPWYAPDAQGNLVTTPIGKGQLQSFFAGYVNVPSRDAAITYGFERQAWPADYARGMDFPQLSIYIRQLQNAGGYVFLSKTDIDQIAARQNVNPLNYFSTGNPAAWRASPPASDLVMLG